MDVNVMGTRLRSIFLAFIIVTAAGVATASATQPSPPESYYGTVTVNGEPAPDGAVVTAIVDGEVKDQLAVSDGTYGGPGAFEEKLVVNATENDTVKFRVAGLDTGQTDSLDPGEVTELNLTLTDNQSPTADTGADATVSVDETVQFDGSNSTDNSDFLTYEWDFDSDGTTDATGVTVNRSYSQSGTFDAVLTVTDIAGNADQSVKTVSVESTSGGGSGGSGGTGGGGGGSQGTTTEATTTASQTTQSATETQSTTQTTSTGTTKPTTTESPTSSNQTSTSSTSPDTTEANTTVTEDADTSPTGTEPSSTSVPGFGVGISIIAVLAAAALAARNQ